MNEYTCEKCGKEFKTKSRFTIHQNRKTPCKKDDCKKDDIVFDIIDNETNNTLVTNIAIPKPIIKWVGGKTQILDKLLKHFPNEINNYHEIFLGGGSVLLAVLDYVKAGIIKIKGNIYAYDLNSALIGLYKNIQDNHEKLYEELQQIIQQFNQCLKGPIERKPKNILDAMLAKENYYYWSRQQYNNLSIASKLSPLGSALFIFLNKTCFRGLYRVGPHGFNVPYGNYNNPEIINKTHLDEIHELIQGVIFECKDFTISLKQVQSGDYVYLDPPYAPETNTSFVKYTETGFSLDMHTNLFELLDNLNARFLHSNSDVSFVRDHFNCEKYHLDTILCKRAINSKNPEAKTNELLIRNY
jgi:DNA adenine methylase